MSSDPSSSSAPGDSPAPPSRWASIAIDVVWVVMLVIATAALWTERVTETGITYNIGAGDVFGYFLPAYEFQAERLAAGAVPFWNPYQGAGTPFLATLQPGTLYPARLLLLVTTPAQAIGWSVFAHVLLALLGTYAFCRTLGTSPMAAAMAGVIFATAFALPWIHAITLLEPGAWLPLLAVAVVKILSGGGWGWVLFLGGGAAMPILSGGYQMAIYTCYGLAIVVLAVLVDRWWRGETIDLRALGRLALAGVLAVATAAPQLLTTLAWSAETVRQTRQLSDVQLMSLVTEGARASRVHAFFYRVASAQTAYFSIPVAVLAAIGLVRGRLLGLVLGLGALATGMLSLVHPWSPLFPVYKALPGLAMFRFPIRMLMLTVFFTAVSASLGVTAIGRSRPFARFRPVRIGVDVVALALVVVLLAWPYENTVEVPWRHDSPSLKPDPRFVSQFIRHIGAERVFVPGDRLDLRMGTFVRQGMRRHVRVLQDYEPLSSGRLGTFLAAVAGMRPPRPNTLPAFSGAMLGQKTFARPDLLDLVAVRAVQAPVDWLPPGGIPGWVPLERTYGLGTWLNSNALPRAYVLQRARFAADEADALAQITADDFDRRVEAVLVGSPETPTARSLVDGLRSPFAPVGILVDEPEEVVVDTGGRAGLLVLADAFAPGWEAYVEGAPRPVWQTNYLVRGVVIEPGERRVVFRYRAPGFAAGVSLAAGTWLVALALLAVARVRRSGGTSNTVAC